MRFDLVYPSWRWSDGHRGTCSGHLLAMAPWRHEIFLNSWYRKEHHVPFYNGYRNQYVYNNKYIHYTYRYLIFFMGTWTFVHQIYLYIYIYLNILSELHLFSSFCWCSPGLPGWSKLDQGEIVRSRWRMASTRPQGAQWWRCCWKKSPVTLDISTINVFYYILLYIIIYLTIDI